MKDKIRLTIDMPDEIFEWVYKPMQTVFAGTWDEFNTLMIYTAIMSYKSVWDISLDYLKIKNELPCRKDECKFIDCTVCFKEKKKEVKKRLEKEMDDIVTKLKISKLEQLMKMAKNLFEDI